MATYSLDDLVYLMARLRDPQDGCPWDLEQTFDSIIPFTIEETYELVDALERADYPQIKDELGDVLFQVIFYSQLATEDKLFSLDDVIDNLVNKLIRRHPHVFPDGSLQSRKGQQDIEKDQVKVSWEAIKAAERSDKAQPRLLDDIPTALPALTRANKLQKRAARVGFDWDNIDDVLSKVKEEIAELESARASGIDADIEHELGDLLFSCVNLARHLKQVPETALRKANGRFEQRFGHVESRLVEQGVAMEEASVELMESLWQEAKEKGL